MGVALSPSGLSRPNTTGAPSQGASSRLNAPAGPVPNAVTSVRPSWASRRSADTASAAEDPEPLYAHGGAWDKAFPTYAFDGTGRVCHLLIRYPAYFTDGEAESRAPELARVLLDLVPAPNES